MSCTDACVNKGVAFIEKTFLDTLKVVYPTGFPFPEWELVAGKYRAAFCTLQANLPPNIIDLISAQIVLIRTASETNITQTNTAYIVVIFVTLLLLVICNYVNLLIGSQTATIIFFVLSIIIVIAGAAILYFWLNSIFSASADQVAILFGHITDILNNVIGAGQKSLCCLGNCADCSLCPNTL